MKNQWERCLCEFVCVVGVLIRAGEGERGIQTLKKKIAEGDAYSAYSGSKNSSFYDKTIT